MRRIVSVIISLAMFLSFYPIAVSYAAISTECDFSNGLPGNIELYLADGCSVTVETDSKSGSDALKIVQNDLTGGSSVHYRFPKVTNGKIKAEFDFRFENNSKNVTSIGNFLAFNAWKKAGNFCQRTNSLWHDSNAWLFVMEKPYEYFHFEQIFNFETREYEYKVSQNGVTLYEYYTVNTDEKLTYLDSLLFNVQHQPGLNGPDSGDGIFWVDNISVEYADAELSSFSCNGELSPYEDRVTIEVDALLECDDFSEYVAVYRNGEILSDEAYEITYSEKTGIEGKLTTYKGHINITFIKDTEFYNSEYELVIKDGIKTKYGGVVKGGSFKFNVPDYIGIYSAKITDELGREISHIQDAAGKEVVLSVICHDTMNKGYFATTAIKDGNGRLVNVNTLKESRDIKIRIPDLADSSWYMELYIFDSSDTIKPYREKKVCFKDKIIKVGEDAKNLEEALEMAKNVSEGYTGITILLEGGEYRLEDTLKINEKFPLPLEITAPNGEEVNIDNRIRFDVTTEITDEEILSRINENVVCFDLKEYGITEIEELKPYGQNYSVNYSDIGVYSENTMMNLARYPDEGYLTMKNIIDNGNFSSTNEADKNNRGGAFYYSGADTSSWQDKSEVWMFGYPRYTWQHLFVKLDSVTDNQITTHHPSTSGFFYGQGFYFVNVLEELDSPGEYYIDRDTKLLYVYNTGEEISISQFKKPFLEINGVSDITFRNVNFYGTRSGAVDVKNSSNIDFDGCDISCIGKYGINMSNVTDCDFVNGEIGYVGTTGIKIESGDKSTMESCNNKIMNNDIHDFGYIEKTYNPAISINSIGDTISHNEIYNSDHMAISAYGNNNVYEYNDIHDVLRYAEDSGAVYTGRSWISGGNIFRYNYFHDFLKSKNSLSNNAIYLDDIMFNAIIYGNIFENLETGVFVHGGRCNEIYSNIFIDVETPIEVVHVYSTEALGGIVANAYVALLNKAFADAFTNLVKTIGDENSEPKYNKAYNNALIYSGEVLFDETAISSATIENNVVTDKSIFNGYGYEINESSPIYNLIPEFINIKFEKIGLR